MVVAKIRGTRTPGQTNANELGARPDQAWAASTETRCLFHARAAYYHSGWWCVSAMLVHWYRRKAYGTALLMARTFVKAKISDSVSADICTWCCFVLCRQDTTTSDAHFYVHTQYWLKLELFGTLPWEP